MVDTVMSPATGRRPELLWVGSGGWVACDPLAEATDPHRVVAYLECKNERVYVLWVTGPTGVCAFGSIREALDRIGERLAPARL